MWPWFVAAAALIAAFLYFGPFRSQPATLGGSPSSDDPRITLVAGQSAPDFTLPSTDGRSVPLSELRAGANVLLYFQEGIMCPPCWQQMRDLKRDADRLASLNTVLVTRGAGWLAYW